VPASDAPDGVEARVRQRLRALRQARGLTLQEVAGRAHLSTSTLSRLESGKRRLALDHIPGLAAALGVTADDLLGPAPREDPRVRAEPIRGDGLTLWPLTRHGPARGVHAYKVVVAPDRRVPPDPLPVHDGHDWMYVLAGTLRLVLDGDELLVEPGEAVEFSTTTPHWFGAADGPVELIALFGPHGEQVHVHP